MGPADGANRDSTSWSRRISYAYPLLRKATPGPSSPEGVSQPVITGNSVTNHPRIDKWLWSARFFKTRGAATAACVAGKVKAAGRAVKPASPVAIGDEIRITRKSHKQTVRVTGMQSRRVGAKLASEMYADITPAAELDNLEAYNTAESAFRQSRRNDSGRPTKRERRAIQKLKGMT